MTGDQLFTLAISTIPLAIALFGWIFTIRHQNKMHVKSQRSKTYEDSLAIIDSLYTSVKSHTYTNAKYQDTSDSLTPLTIWGSSEVVESTKKLISILRLLGEDIANGGQKSDYYYSKKMDEYFNEYTRMLKRMRKDLNVPCPHPKINAYDRNEQE